MPSLALTLKSVLSIVNGLIDLLVSGERITLVGTSGRSIGLVVDDVLGIEREV